MEDRLAPCPTCRLGGDEEGELDKVDGHVEHFQFPALLLLLLEQRVHDAIESILRARYRASLAARRPRARYKVGSQGTHHERGALRLHLQGRDLADVQLQAVLALPWPRARPLHARGGLGAGQRPASRGCGEFRGAQRGRGHAQTQRNARPRSLPRVRAGSRADAAFAMLPKRRMPWQATLTRSQAPPHGRCLPLERMHAALRATRGRSDCGKRRAANRIG